MTKQDDQKQQVQDASDIVALVGEHVALKRKGREFVGLCPFHDDKNPSMSVVPHKQIFHCFVCGAGGDVFTWMMKYHRMAFPEALSFLADRAGITLQRSGDAEAARQSRSQRDAVADACAKASRFFQRRLADPEAGQTARAYLAKRGFDDQMIRAFELGVAPQAWDALAQHIAHARWDLKAFEAAGLVSPRQNGQGHYDRLRHRIIFPIHDALGRVIAFGGRRLNDEDEPKYLNSPETVLFHKSSTMYGLHHAKKAMMQSGSAVIVEGYTDVMAAHAAGAKNVVATLGTALTSDHATQLRRFVERVILIFDADEAGLKAADRALEVFVNQPLDVAVAVLPHGQDPADLFAGEDGLAIWNQCMEQAIDALEFQFQRVQQQLDAARTLSGKQQIVEQFIAKLADFGLAQQGHLRRAMILQKVASLLGLGVSHIEQMLDDAARRSLQLSSRRRQVRAVQADSATNAADPVNAANPATPANRAGRQIAQRGKGAQRQPAEGHPADPNTSEPLGEVSPFRADDNAGQDGSSTVSQDMPASHGEPEQHISAGLRLAEKQIIGVLMIHPQFGDEPLQDQGPGLVEQLGLSDLVTAAGRMVYGVVMDRLLDGKAAHVAAITAELAARGQDALVPFAMACEQVVEQACGIRTEKDRQSSAPQARELLIGAVTGLMHHRHEQAYWQQQRQRQLAIAAGAAGAAETGKPAGHTPADRAGEPASVSAQSDADADTGAEPGTDADSQVDADLQQQARLLQQAVEFFKHHPFAGRTLRVTETQDSNS